jgi:hypothetical protein
MFEINLVLRKLFYFASMLWCIDVDGGRGQNSLGLCAPVLSDIFCEKFKGMGHQPEGYAAQIRFKF